VNLHDILEEGGTIALQLASDFPIEELEEIAQYLAGATYLIPGFIPAEAGFLNLHTLILDQHSSGIETYILPDRNVVTRMARIAEQGIRAEPDKQQYLAANLMALAQIVDWQIDPSIAFYELAHRKGNEIANLELSWFRTADEARPFAWINVALQKSRSLGDLCPAEGESVDLERPLTRWQYDYAACLKLAELELSPSFSPSEKVASLLHWMDCDFYFGGSAAMFAICYFGPSSRRSGMLKNLRSSDRRRAIAGAKNAAWDIRYLGEFSSKARLSNFPEKQYVLATGDKSLAQVAQSLFVRGESGNVVDEFANMFCQWWPEYNAQEIATQLVDCMDKSNERALSKKRPYSIKRVSKAIAEGERFVLEWTS
jgi:hypothetical protein